MRNAFKTVDSLSESAFSLLGKAAKVVGQEFRKHPITTPIAIASGALIWAEVNTFLDRRERKQGTDSAVHYAGEQLTAETAQINLNVPETAHDDR